MSTSSQQSAQERPQQAAGAQDNGQMDRGRTGQPPQKPDGNSGEMTGTDRPEPPEGAPAFGDDENRPEPPEGAPAFGDDENRPEPPEGAPAFGNDEDRPEPPEGAPAFGNDEDRPEPPEDVTAPDNSNQPESGKQGNFFSRIGGAMKNGMGRIGKWFKGLIGKKDAADETDDSSDADETDTDEADSEDESGRPARPSFPGNGRAGGQNGGNEQMPGGKPGDMPNGMPGGMGGESAPEEYEAATVVTEDAEGTAYTSTGSGENAILVDSDTVTLTGITVDKTGDSDGESADFYGINAGILANNGADLTLAEATITTDGAHANGVFSYGEGTTVTISDSTITTTGNNSGGLMTTGGGTLYADNVEISTSGNSSAAIRTDRGGGTVVATDSTGTTSGVGSPAIYSTADIKVSNSTLTADNSEAVVIEGGNSVTLTNTNLTGNDATLNGQSTKNTNVLIYQSMSGDASEGASDFTMIGGSLTSLTGSMFHVTNVTTTINLKNVELSYADDSDILLDLSADSWGSSGKNGGYATVNLSDQTAQGVITVDEVSGLTLKITDSSSYTGAINPTGSAGSVKVTLESGSTWKLTGDTYIDSFEGDLSGVDTNGYTLYINGTAYQG